jgi:uncharacterized membrane protein YcaP (DUF421 family)
MLIYHGKIIKKHLDKVELTKDELEAAVREHGVEDVSKVDLAVMEIDGNISILSDHFKKHTLKKRIPHKLLNKSS